MAKKNTELQTTTTTPNLPDLKVDNELLDLLPRAETSDFDIPRLTLIQPTSKIEGSPGDIVDSSTGQKVSGLNEKLVFCPVWFLKDYAVSEVETQKFRRNEPKTADNAHFSVFNNRVGTDPDGVSVKRDERLNLFLIQNSTLDDDLPRMYRMVIKPSSFKEAKKFLSEWDIQIRSGLLPFMYLWSVTPKMEKNDKGKFCVYNFAKEMNAAEGGGRPGQTKVDTAHAAKVQFWVKTLVQNKDKVLKSDSVPDDEGTITTEAIPF